MSIAAKAIDIARAEVGYQEEKGNRSKYAAEKFPTVNGLAWCGSFAGWVYAKAGFQIGKHVWIPSVEMTKQWAIKHGFFKTSSPKAGDLVIYNWNGGRADHIGIAWPDPKASGYRAIEGNTSPGSAGSQSNGGGVYVRYRGRRSIDGWVDMGKVLAHYLGSKAATTVIKAEKKASGHLTVDGVLGKRTAQELQARLGVTVDGVLGPASIKALQRYLRATYRDGKLSHQRRVNAKYLPSIRRDCITYATTGSSDTVKRLQAYVGAKPDGLTGPDTIKKAQAFMNKWPKAFTVGSENLAAQRIKAAGL